MGDVGGEVRLRRVLAREAQWGVTSITLLEVYPSRRVQQLSEIDSPLRIRLVPFLEFQEPDRRKQPEYPPVPAHLAERQRPEVHARRHARGAFRGHPSALCG